MLYRDALYRRALYWTHVDASSVSYSGRARRRGPARLRHHAGRRGANRREDTAEPRNFIRVHQAIARSGSGGRTRRPATARRGGRRRAPQVLSFDAAGTQDSEGRGRAIERNARTCEGLWFGAEAQLGFTAGSWPLIPRSSATSTAPR